MLHNKFIFILGLLSFWGWTYGIASENIYQNKNEDFEIEEDFYRSFNIIQVYDPYERLNRSIYKFNKIVDKFIISPPAQIYHTITPTPVKRRLNSFINNLKEPLNTIYGILQLNPKIAFNSFFRFFINSTFGILGIFDIAKLTGLKSKKISFSNVLKYYGGKEGPYVILPILGPSTMTDSLGLIIDATLSPVNIMKYKNKSKFRNYYFGTEVITTQEKFTGGDKILSEISLDEYLVLRDFYYQKLSKSLQKEN